MTIRWRAAAVLIVAVVLASGPADAQPQAGGSAVAGIVVDATNAVLPNASVTLETAAGAAVQSTATDTVGAFRFEHITPGRYRVLVTFEGFQPTAVRVTVGARAPGPLHITMPLANVTQEVTVSNAPAQVTTDSAKNLDAVTVDEGMLQSLPVFDQDYIATLSQFLDPGAVGTSGVTIVVNGMEVNALNVSASAVQQIKINQDPYSAEYSRPGRGRIEILTKAGSQQYHGSANVFFRNAQLNARNAFAPERVHEERRIFEGFVGGPLGRSGRLSFMISGTDRVEDVQAVVYAAAPSGTINESVPQRNRESLASGSITYQRSDTTTISIRPSYQLERNDNRGVGGTTLPSAGTNFEHTEEDVTYLQQTILTSSLLNQFQILVGHEREPTVSVTADRGLVVVGAFTGGGAQSDLLRTELHMQMNQSLTWTRSHHLVQFGFQVPDWSRRGFDDHSNFGGTFYFSGLDTYERNRPYSFIQQRGNGDLSFLEKVVGGYAKDDWQIHPGLSVAFGVRYDWQNYFHDNNNIAPRASFALAPGDGKANVIRGGVGRFNDRTGPVPIADLLHYESAGLTKFVITDPSYPDPYQSLSAVTSPPPSAVQLAPDIQIPFTWQYGVGLDHQVRTGTTLSTTYSGSRGYHLFRSRDINAPLPPFYAERPDAAFGAVRQIESTGRLHSDSLQVTLRGNLVRRFSGQMQYTLSRAQNDTNGVASYPAYDYDLSGEWGRADFDRRHRFLLLGRAPVARLLDVGVGIALNSGGPYSETLGADIYNNGRGRARPPGVSRNSLEGGGYASVDLRASREIVLGGDAKNPRAVTIAVEAFNLLNHVNYINYVGTIGSQFFGQPVAARSPRQLQLSARLKF